jgi:hypothetical protein
MKKLSSISYDTYLFQIKGVDEMFVIILKKTSLNLFGCKEVTIVYSDLLNPNRLGQLLVSNLKLYQTASLFIQNVLMLLNI